MWGHGVFNKLVFIIVAGTLISYIALAILYVKYKYVDKNLIE